MRSRGGCAPRRERNRIVVRPPFARAPEKRHLTPLGAIRYSPNRTS